MKNGNGQIDAQTREQMEAMLKEPTPPQPELKPKPQHPASPTGALQKRSEVVEQQKAEAAQQLVQSEKLAGKAITHLAKQSAQNLVKQYNDVQQALLLEGIAAANAANLMALGQQLPKLHEFVDRLQSEDATENLLGEDEDPLAQLAQFVQTENSGSFSLPSFNLLDD